MSFATLLQPARVLANVEARSKKHAFEILSELIAGVADDLSQSDVFEALVERERIGNTGLGKGIAIPHGGLPDIKTPVGAFLKLSEAVDYGAQDGVPVRLIMAVAVPGDEQSDHFEEVARSARALTDARLIESLNEVSGSRALYEILAGHSGDVDAGTQGEGAPDEKALQNDPAGDSDNALALD